MEFDYRRTLDLRVDIKRKQVHQFRRLIIISKVQEQSGVEVKYSEIN